MRHITINMLAKLLQHTLHDSLAVILGNEERSWRFSLPWAAYGSLHQCKVTKDHTPKMLTSCVGRVKRQHNSNGSCGRRCH